MKLLMLGVLDKAVAEGALWWGRLLSTLLLNSNWRKNSSVGGRDTYLELLRA